MGGCAAMSVVALDNRLARPHHATRRIGWTPRPNGMTDRRTAVKSSKCVVVEPLTKTTMTRRHLLRRGAAVTAVGTAAIALPGFATAAGAADGQASEDGSAVAAIYRLQAAFHRAKSHQDIDLMVSLWTQDATFQFAGTNYTGRDAVRAFFLGSGSWHHQRISLVPSFKDQIVVRNDHSALLYFECHDVALTDESPTVSTGTIVTHLFNVGTVHRVNHDWLFQDMQFGSAAPLSVDTIYHS
jgi:ketosteroid isomerase-like protein